MNFGEPMQRNIDQDAEEDAEEYFYGCEFHDCTHSFEREDDLEQHYTSFHSADVYTSQIQESSVRKLLPHEVKSKAKRIDIFCKKEYPRHSHGASAPRSFIDRFTKAHPRIDLHPSEPGCNLPQDHARHILKFPTEILDRILEFILVTPKTITPLCIRCQVDGKMREPTYSVGHHWQDEQQDLYRVRATPNCELGRDLLRTEYEAEYRRPIDATVLRVCKPLQRLGLPLLYGKNTFAFDLEDIAYQHRIVVMMAGNGLLEAKQRWMPSIHVSETIRIQVSIGIQASIGNLYSTQNPLDLPHWMITDPFIRFLFSIGPINASGIRKLKISGRLFPDCSYYYGFPTLDGNDFGRSLTYNLSYYVTAYAPFISLYCPNLDKLNISIHDFIHTYHFPPTASQVRVAGFDDSPAKPQYNEIQQGDAEIDQETLRDLRAFREEMRLKWRTKQIARTEKNVASHLKPILEKATSNMTNLRTLEVMRFPPQPWNANDGMKYNFPQPRATKWVEMDLGKDAQVAITRATRKRMRAFEDEEEMAELELQEEKKANKRKKGKQVAS